MVTYVHNIFYKTPNMMQDPTVNWESDFSADSGCPIGSF